jgi:tripartite ATP-independent transporter DctP family solute receptor
VTLVYAEVNPLDTTVVGQVATHFAERVNELSGGTVTIDVQGGGVLGAEGDYCDNMIGGVGTIDMARLSVSTLTGYGVPKSTLLCLPFTFVSRDHFWNFAASDIAQEFMDEPYENGLGLHGLFLGEEGFRHIFTNKPASGLDDLQGMKIRVSTDPTMVGMIEAFGASPTVVAYGELYQSLQSGVVDGAENPVGNYKANSFYEVAPNLILDGHQLGVIELVITDFAWNKLTEAQQECIKIAAKECQEYNKELSEKIEEDTLAELGDQITVVEVDKQEWIDKCADVIAEATKDYADLYEQIESMQ